MPFTVPARARVIVDHHFSGDPDNLFQLVYHLASPSVTVSFVVGRERLKALVEGGEWAPLGTTP